MSTNKSNLNTMKERAQNQLRKAASLSSFYKNSDKVTHPTFKKKTHSFDESKQRRTSTLASALNQNNYYQKSIISDRLQEIVIFELHEDGTRSFMNLTLRDLYTYVIKCIRTGKAMEQQQQEVSISNLTKDNDDIEGRGSENKVSTLTASNISTTSTSTESRYRTSAYIPSQSAAAAAAPQQNQNTTYRERLGGYLHPRDMRRLITPFSTSNEPQCMVRRHVMLLNFDPLRAIVLRDRLLVLVPDGADLLLIEIENRIMGNRSEMETMLDNTTDSSTTKSSLSQKANNHIEEEEQEGENNENNDDEFSEWEDIDNMKWIKVSFELTAVDGILQTILMLISDDASTLSNEARHEMDALRGSSANTTTSRQRKTPTYLLQERLRILKDRIKEMESRVNGFVRALNLVLDEDEDMALMNLSRLLTHPERFVQPVSREVLEEESDEPELILEAYLQEALSIANALDFLKSQVLNTEEQVAMKMDSIRNQLLFINALLTIVTVCLTAASLVGSIFGMNLTNYLEEGEHTFGQVVSGTIIGSFLLFLGLWYYFQRTVSISHI